MGFLGFRVEGLGFRVEGLGFGARVYLDVHASYYIYIHMYFSIHKHMQIDIYIYEAGTFMYDLTSFFVFILAYTTATINRVIE